MFQSQNDQDGAERRSTCFIDEWPWEKINQAALLDERKKSLEFYQQAIKAAVSQIAAGERLIAIRMLKA